MAARFLKRFSCLGSTSATAGKKRTGEAVAGAPKAKAKAKSKLPVADEAEIHPEDVRPWRP